MSQRLSGSLFALGIAQWSACQHRKLQRPQDKCSISATNYSHIPDVSFMMNLDFTGMDFIGPKQITSRTSEARPTWCASLLRSRRGED